MNRELVLHDCEMTISDEGDPCDNGVVVGLGLDPYTGFETPACRAHAWDSSVRI